jgi:Arc/MetJ-type ribon-helix-helix transcriptional regulator
MKRVNFKIDDERKEEVEQYVEENSEYPSMSHFFRLAAEKEMGEDEERPHQIPPRVTRTLDKIVGELDELRTSIDGITARLEADETDIEILAQEVYDTLPVAPAVTKMEAAASGESMQCLEQRYGQLMLEEVNTPSTVPELAQHLNTDKEEIKEALHHLKSNFLPIMEFMDDDGNKHFFKQEERR